ncbi:hypothetical protein GOP47_0029364 [Adiantum capillus-veneris]|nr:hypothetical protein GOP47_0029364 [Adiantum capillus-veneris]
MIHIIWSLTKGSELCTLMVQQELVLFCQNTVVPRVKWNNRIVVCAFFSGVVLAEHAGALVPLLLLFGVGFGCRGSELALHGSYFCSWRILAPHQQAETHYLRERHIIGYCLDVNEAGCVTAQMYSYSAPQ